MNTIPANVMIPDDDAMPLPSQIAPGIQEEQIEEAREVGKFAKVIAPNGLRTLVEFLSQIQGGRGGLHLRYDAKTEIELKLASSWSKNPGSVYVAINDVYAGKISPEGVARFYATPTGVEGYLADVARDPMPHLLHFGRITGRCAVCGQKLTDAVSIAEGIGPVCADRVRVRAKRKAGSD